MKKDFASALGIVMRASRKNSGLTIAEVADSIGMPTSVVRLLEAGNGIPHTGHRELYARAVGTTEVDLLQRAWMTHDLLGNIQPLRTT